MCEYPISESGWHPKPPGIAPVPRSDRRMVEMRAYAIRFDNSIVDLRVVDLSYDGCAVETTEALVPGELLKLSVLERGFVRATVRWYKGRKAGLLFDPERRDREYRQRTADRLEIAAHIVLRRSARKGYPVRTSDLTRFGCKCEFVERPEMKERVWVKLAHLESLEAEVCWLVGSSVGLKFANPLHPAVFDLLLGQLQG